MMAFLSQASLEPGLSALTRLGAGFAAPEPTMHPQWSEIHRARGEACGHDSAMPIGLLYRNIAG